MKAGYLVAVGWAEPYISLLHSHFAHLTDSDFLFYFFPISDFLFLLCDVL